MFNFNLKAEEILLKITAIKTVTTKEAILNFVGNLLTPAGGDVANKINLILTKDTLYLEYKGHVSIGYAEETRDVDKILLNDLESFSVISKGNEEVLEIKTNVKNFLFVRDNIDNSNLGLAMSTVVNDLKLNI